MRGAIEATIIFLEVSANSALAGSDITVEKSDKDKNAFINFTDFIRFFNEQNSLPNFVIIFIFKLDLRKLRKK